VISNDFLRKSNTPSKGKILAQFRCSKECNVGSESDSKLDRPKKKKSLSNDG
jgi:hypothetical protein